MLDARLPAVLAHRSDWGGRTFVAIHNLSEEPCVARVRLGADVPEDPRVHDLLDTTMAASHELQRNELEVKLEGFGYRWFRIQGPEQHTAP